MTTLKLLEAPKKEALVEKRSGVCDFCHDEKEVVIGPAKDLEIPTLQQGWGKTVKIVRGGTDPVYPLFGRFYYKIPDYDYERVYEIQQTTVKHQIDICQSCARSIAAMFNK